MAITTWNDLKQVALSAISTSWFPFDGVQEYKEQWAANPHATLDAKGGWVAFKQFYKAKVEILERFHDLKYTCSALLCYFRS